MPYGFPPGLFGTYVSPADLAKLATMPDGSQSTFQQAIEIDLAVAGYTTILAPGDFILGAPGTAVWITAKDGTVTTGPVISAGCNATADDYVPAGLPVATLAAAPLATRVGSIGTSVNPIPIISLNPNGFRIRVVTPAVLGTATQFRCVYLNSLARVPSFYP